LPVLPEPNASTIALNAAISAASPITSAAQIPTELLASRADLGSSEQTAPRVEVSEG
jgi:hypothetical protein